MPTAFVAMLLIAFCNCAKPNGQFWIDGLALPPGSNVSSRQETPDDQYVAFSYPDSWEDVEAYFDTAFEPLGYKEADADDVAAFLHEKHHSWDDAQLKQEEADVDKKLADLTGLEHPKETVFTKTSSSYIVYFVEMKQTEPGRPAFAVYVSGPAPKVKPDTTPRMPELTPQQ